MAGSVGRCNTVDRSGGPRTKQGSVEEVSAERTVDVTTHAPTLDRLQLGEDLPQLQEGEGRPATVVAGGDRGGITDQSFDLRGEGDDAKDTARGNEGKHPVEVGGSTVRCAM